MAISPLSKSTQIGKAGEYLALSVFHQHHYQCSLVNLEGCDIVLWADDDGTPFRVEVKAASEAIGKGRYKFMTSKGSKSKRAVNSDDADLICYVALDIRKICLRPINTVVNKRTTLRACEFDLPECQQIRTAIRDARK